MQFSEDDLKRELQRKDPGAAFTQRVMARVNQQERGGESPATERPVSSGWFGWMRMRPAWIGAVAAIVMAVIGLGGYHEYQQRQAQRAKEELAAQQAELALRITTAKLNHVFNKVRENSRTSAE